MTNQELFRAVGQVREDQILEADKPATKKAPHWRRYGAIAACLVLLLGAGFALNREIRWNRLIGNFHPAIGVDAGGGAAAGGLDGSDYSIDGQGIFPAPSYSVGAEIGQLSGPGKEISSSACIADVMWLTPEELFAQDTVIFRGKVRELQYYVVTVDNIDTYYTKAIVQVTDCLRGQLGAGDVYSILYMGVKGYEVNSLSGPLANLDEGDEAVFMPIWTSPDTGWRSGEDYFCYADLASLYLSEGMRFVFAETVDGLLFDQSAYEEIANTETLDEVVEYIRRMIGEEEQPQPVVNPTEFPITPQTEPSHTAQAGETAKGPAGAREMPGGAYVGDE